MCSINATYHCMLNRMLNRRVAIECDRCVGEVLVKTGKCRNEVHQHAERWNVRQRFRDLSVLDQANHACTLEYEHVSSTTQNCRILYYAATTPKQDSDRLGQNLTDKP